MNKNKIGRTSLVFYKFVKLNKFFILKNSSLKFVVFVCQELSLSLSIFVLLYYYFNLRSSWTSCPALPLQAI